MKESVFNPGFGFRPLFGHSIANHLRHAFFRISDLYLARNVHNLPHILDNFPETGRLFQPLFFMEL